MTPLGPIRARRATEDRSFAVRGRAVAARWSAVPHLADTHGGTGCRAGGRLGGADPAYTQRGGRLLTLRSCHLTIEVSYTSCSCRRRQHWSPKPNVGLQHCPNCGGELKIIAAILERPMAAATQGPSARGGARLKPRMSRAVRPGHQPLNTGSAARRQPRWHCAARGLDAGRLRVNPAIEAKRAPGEWSVTSQIEARQRPRRQFRALRTGIGRPRRSYSGRQAAV